MRCQYKNYIIFVVLKRIVFHQNEKVEYPSEDGSQVFEFPYYHSFSADEIKLAQNAKDDFAKRVKSYYSSIDPSLQSSFPMAVSLEEYFILYKWKKKALNAAIENLKEQRNKIYAHNDINSKFDIDSIEKQFPISMEDMRNLTAYALDLSRIVIALCTGVYKADKPINIGDLRNTLHMVRIGMKYQKQYYDDTDKEDT